MPGITWIQVLEIETIMIKIMSENALGFQVRIWESDMKHNMTLHKNKSYTVNDVKEYLFAKYPKNEFFRNSTELIDKIYNFLIIGNSIIEVDQELYDLNLNPEPLQTSVTEQRVKFLEAYNQEIGADIYWYNVLKEVIQQQRQYDLTKIIQDFLGILDELLRNEVGFSIADFDNILFDNQWVYLKYDPQLKVKLFSKFEVIKSRIIAYEKNSMFAIFRKMCNANGYDFFYKDSAPSTILRDSIAFSVNLCIKRVLNDTFEIFGYELRKSISLYPQDLMQNPYNTLMVYITPFGFYTFEKIVNLFDSGELDIILKSFIAREFDVVDKAAIVDNEDSVSMYSRFNSTFIVGKNLEYRTFWGRRTKQFIEKLLSGTFWYHDDLNGTKWGFIGLHPESAFEGEFKHSMPAKNVLYYYSELRLEKAQWDRELDEIYEAGYRDSVVEDEDEDEDEDEEDYDNEW